MSEMWLDAYCPNCRTSRTCTVICSGNTISTDVNADQSILGPGSSYSGNMLWDIVDNSKENRFWHLYFTAKDIIGILYVLECAHCHDLNTHIKWLYSVDWDDIDEHMFEDYYEGELEDEFGDRYLNKNLSSEELSSFYNKKISYIKNNALIINEKEYLVCGSHTYTLLRKGGSDLFVVNEEVDWVTDKEKFNARFFSRSAWNAYDEETRIFLTDFVNRFERLFFEVKSCIKDGRFITATSGARTLIELMCQLSGPDTAKGLSQENFDRFGGLISTGILSPRNEDLLRRFYAIGNRATHDGSYAEPDRLSAIIVVIERTMRDLWHLIANDDENTKIVDSIPKRVNWGKFDLNHYDKGFDKNINIRHLRNNNPSPRTSK